MADLILKQQNLAAKAVDLATRLDDLLDDLTAFGEEYQQTLGITDDILASQDTTIHLTSVEFSTLLLRYNSALTWFASNDNRDILRKARR